MKVNIHTVESSKDKKRFIDFPHMLYEGDPNYVPELYMGISEVLSRKKNPFFEHSDAILFLATSESGEIVGRISASIDNNYNAYHQSNVGFFGFFDVIEDYAVAQALLDHAFEWLKKHQVDAVLGPTNFTTNDTAGMLVDGFDGPPTVQMTYNKPYYNDFVEKYGFRKEMDLYAYFIPTQGVNEKALALSKRIQERLERKGIKIRTMTKQSKKKDLEQIKSIYRKAWEKNWGFVPPTDKEYEHLKEGLSLLIDNRFIYLAEKDNQMIGFAAAIPNINEITIDFKKGRLFPFNIFKLLFKKSKVKVIRIILLGVVEEYRKLGIEAVFFARYIDNAKKIGLKGGEASWILESNTMMVQAAEKLNGKRYRTYRIYRKSI